MNPFYRLVVVAGVGSSDSLLPFWNIGKTAKSVPRKPILWPPSTPGIPNYGVIPPPIIIVDVEEGIVLQDQTALPESGALLLNRPVAKLRFKSRVSFQEK